MKLVEIPNGSLKQYYYNVIKELYNIRRDDISKLNQKLSMPIRQPKKGLLKNKLMGGKIRLMKELMKL